MELMTEEKKGFKKTEVGLIPEDWVVTNLGQIADVKTGPFGSSLHKEDYVEVGTPIITVEHLGVSQITTQNLPKVSYSDYKRLRAYKLRTGDIVFSRVGSIDRNAFVTDDENGWLFSGRLLRIRVTNEDVSPKYLSYHFSQNSFKERIRSVAVGQTMPSLNTKILDGIYVVTPPTLAEQQAISTALSDVDELIRSLDLLIQKKEAIKKGTMQQLLTGKKRLLGFDGEWEVKRLDKMGSTFNGLTGKKKADFGDGNHPYITFLNVMNNTIIDTALFDSVVVKTGESQSEVKKGDLLFNTSSETPEEVGMCAVILDKVESLHLNSFCFGFRLTDKADSDPLFLAYYFRSDLGRNLMNGLAQGSTRYNLSKSKFVKLGLNLPSYKEQKAIAQILSDMDEELQALRRKREKMVRVKEGMMQQLLTGRIRIFRMDG